MRLYIGLFLGGLLAPGLAVSLAQSPSPPERGRRLSSGDLAACVNRGGHIAIAGLSGNQTCVLPLPDAGKACSSSSQCVGQCLLDEASLRGRPLRHDQRVSGRCQATDYGFGCRTTVENGRVDMSICVD